jgi:DsbC/DsbD-like thiol-disulfide interchange protein
MLSRRFWFCVLGVAVIAVSFGLAWVSKDPSVSLRLNTATAKAGGTVKGTVTIVIPPGYHAYAPDESGNYVKLKVSASSAPIAKLTAAYPKGKPKKLPGFEETVSVYTGTVRIPVTIGLAKNKTGRQTLKVQVLYQLCDEDACYPQGTKSTSATLTIQK